MTARPEPAPAVDATPDGFVPVARLADLPAGALLGARTPDGTGVCLALVGGAVCALRDTCSHQAFPLSAGELAPDGSVECAWHGARFDARTGAVRRGPACEPVTPYEVRVVDGMVYVRAPRA
jgi:3-phenylpropionate/trans-cinnamate dioxygenase ferredoxin subunit